MLAPSWFPTRVVLSSPKGPKLVAALGGSYVVGEFQ